MRAADTPRMTALEFRQALEMIEISQRGSARMFGVDERTVRRWCSGKTPVPKRVELTTGHLIILRELGCV